MSVYRIAQYVRMRFFKKACFERAAKAQSYADDQTKSVHTLSVPADIRDWRHHHSDFRWHYRIIADGHAGICDIAGFPHGCRNRGHSDSGDDANAPDRS